jgi:hypothetical protein
MLGEERGIAGVANHLAQLLSIDAIDTYPLVVEAPFIILATVFLLEMLVQPGPRVFTLSATSSRSVAFHGLLLFIIVHIDVLCHP